MRKSFLGRILCPDVVYNIAYLNLLYDAYLKKTHLFMLVETGEIKGNQRTGDSRSRDESSTADTEVEEDLCCRLDPHSQGSQLVPVRHNEVTNTHQRVVQRGTTDGKDQQANQGEGSRKPNNCRNQKASTVQLYPPDESLI